MIKSFHDADTEQLWKQERARRISAGIWKAALKKLQLLNAAGNLGDLAVPPGNRLERLHGDRAGRYSIRINDQYRLGFHWRDGNAYDVEIVDYH